MRAGDGIALYIFSPFFLWPLRMTTAPADDAERPALLSLRGQSYQLLGNQRSDLGVPCEKHARIHADNVCSNAGTPAARMPMLHSTAH